MIRANGDGTACPDVGYGRTVSRSLVLDVFLWELTIDTSWELLPDERERLIMERDQGLRSMEDDLPPTA